MMNKVIAVCVAMTVIGCAYAADEAPKKEGNCKGMERFKTADVNKDKKLSLDEFKTFCKHPEKATEIFAKLDTDKDGALTPEELKAGREAMKGHKEGKEAPKAK